jgi:hypothetical protein
MAQIRWQIRLGVALVLASLALYVLQYFVFRDVRVILVWLLNNIAFLPIDVLLVTLILSGLLSQREKRARLHKLNMAVGAYFSEVGTGLLRRFCAVDETVVLMRNEPLAQGSWGKERFAALRGRLAKHPFRASSQALDLVELRVFLLARRSFLLGLLQSPTLLEHESFTSLLQAVFHLTEELEARPALDALPQSDYDHLSADINRVYGLMVLRWLDYMQHLRANYPYLFSLAIRLNPFDPDASPIVR